MGKYGFACFEDKALVENSFKLQPGDLLCCNGHVEFYKGEEKSKSFGWGDVHNTYDNYTGIDFSLGTYYNNDKPPEENPQHCLYGTKDDRAYIRVYRYIGGKSYE